MAAGGTRATRSFAPLPDAVAMARAYVTEQLHPLPVALCETAALLVSELATNAILHGPGSFEVSVGRSAIGVRVGVSDAGGGDPILRAPALTDEHGRGLQLVAALADRWGVAANVDSPGKTVWFELPARAAVPRED